jgi:hypothetical protein
VRCPPIISADDPDDGRCNHMMEQAPRGRYEHGAQRRRIGRKVTMAGIRSTALRLMKASRCKSSNGRRGRAIYAPLAMSADSEGLDQFEEGNAIGGHASEVEAVPRPAASPSSPPMTSRRFPASWRADPMPGGYARPGRQWPGPCLPLLPRKRGRSPAGEAATSRGCPSCWGRESRTKSVLYLPDGWTA